MTPTLKKLLLLATLLLGVTGSAMASELTILPDYHLTPRWVKAGAYFKDNGTRVHVDRVNIHVMLPKKRIGNDYVYGVRDHNETNVGEPDWSGWWDEPWRCGFFYYTVTATYRGHRYQRMFFVRRNKYFEVLENSAELARAIAATQSGQ